MAIPTSLITSVSELQDFLSNIQNSTSLYLDLEGSNLSRHGNISLMTVLAFPGERVHLIDVLTLGSTVFTVPSANGTTLARILDDPNIPKYFWDVRNDADALWSLFEVSIAGVIDIQLLENASRGSRDNTFLSGLEKAIRSDLPLSESERQRWSLTKGHIKARMSADAFSARPLDIKTIEYCVNDVIHLPALQAVYERRISPSGLAKAKDYSQRRAVEARSPDYDSQSPDKARGPWAGPPPRLSEEEFWDGMEDRIQEWHENLNDAIDDMEAHIEAWQDAQDDF